MKLWIKIAEQLEPFVPHVKEPVKKLKIQEKIGFTMVVLILYMLMGRVPLYGLRANQSDDPLSFYRVMLASNRGTLMELGISPLVTSSMIIQGVIVGGKLITFNRSDPYEVRMYQVVEKFAALLTIIFQAVAYTAFSGMDIGFGNGALIFIQLCTSSVIISLWDDFLSNGYGFGSATSLFITANLCQSMAWSCFSFQMKDTMSGRQYEGAVIHLVTSLLSKDVAKIRAIRSAFFRTQLPNISNILATFLVVIIVVYFQGFCVEIPVKNLRVRAGTMGTGNYPIRLFYTSNTPIMLQSTMTNTIFMVSSTLYRVWGANLLTKALGQWYLTPNGSSVPIGGLVYYLSAPRNISEIIIDPIHTIVYVVYVLSSCCVFANLWLGISGSGVRDVANNLKAQNLTVVGYRQENLHKVLNRYIPAAAGLGGIMVGALTIFADFMGAIGSGTGILLAVGSILNIIEKIQQQSAEDGFAMGIPGFGKLAKRN